MMAIPTLMLHLLFLSLNETFGLYVLKDYVNTQSHAVIANRCHIGMGGKHLGHLVLVFSAEVTNKLPSLLVFHAAPPSTRLNSITQTQGLACQLSSP
jgi:hypothetical protein